jgi:hypothetical protein
MNNMEQYMSKIISFNSQCAKILLNNSKLRVETTKDGTIRIRPTDRVASKDLTEIDRTDADEGVICAIIPTRYFTEAGRHSTAYEEATHFSLRSEKYQWYALVPLTVSDEHVPGGAIETMEFDAESA